MNPTLSGRKHWRGGRTAIFYESISTSSAPSGVGRGVRIGVKPVPVLRHSVCGGSELDAWVIENNEGGHLPQLKGWDPIDERLLSAPPSGEKRSTHLRLRNYERLRHAASAASVHFVAVLSRVMSVKVDTTAPGVHGRCHPRLAVSVRTQKDQERLLDADFDSNFTGAQFLTELQGGSDVGANATRAVPLSDGTWRLHGEKWFCSNVDADVALVTARYDAELSGTRGLGLFLVPARKPDGRWNDYRVRRLKDKLGTRSMASGEVDFVGTYAEALGPVEQGFLNMMKLVINTSRLYNAFGCSAHIQRAYLVARGYAEARHAFGQPIVNYPMVQESLAFLKSDADACLAGSFGLAGLQEQIETGAASAEEQAFYRVALNINKVQTSAVAHASINRAIQVLGGNGAIETFSVLPRLLRDNVVYEKWGRHGQCRLLQVLKDCQKMALHEGFFGIWNRVLGRNGGPGSTELEGLLQQPPRSPPSISPICAQMAALVQLGTLSSGRFVGNDAARGKTSPCGPLVCDELFEAAHQRT